MKSSPNSLPQYLLLLFLVIGLTHQAPMQKSTRKDFVSSKTSCRGLANFMNASLSLLTPFNGPVEGGTILKLLVDLATHFGIEPNNVQIIIGDLTCSKSKWIKKASGSTDSWTVHCRTGESDKEITHHIEMIIEHTHYARKIACVKSKETFTYQRPKLYGIKPGKGPRSGGTNVTLEGENLNIGNDQTVTLSEHNCDIFQINAKRIDCTTSASYSVMNASVALWIDGNSYKPEPRRFCEMFSMFQYMEEEATTDTTTSSCLQNNATFSPHFQEQSTGTGSVGPSIIITGVSCAFLVILAKILKKKVKRWNDTSESHVDEISQEDKNNSPDRSLDIESNLSEKHEHERLLSENKNTTGKSSVHLEVPFAENNNYPGRRRLDGCHQLKQGTKIYSEMLQFSDIDDILLTEGQLSLGQEISTGVFGCVYRGEYNVPGRPLLEIAVKTVRKGYVKLTKKREELIREGLVMKNLQHDNMLTLIGMYVSEDKSPMLVLPFMEHGSLHSYIRQGSKAIELLELLSFGLQVANGMDYLAGQGLIHRDLAARNCMLGKEKVVKVSGFALSCRIFQGETYIEPNSRIYCSPRMRWMAPETLDSGEYSQSSDVWAYGVLLWEIFTGGSEPYEGLTYDKVLLRIRDGRRLPKPPDCPEKIFELMLSCWKQEPSERPRFQDLVDELSK